MDAGSQQISHAASVFYQDLASQLIRFIFKRINT